MATGFWCTYISFLLVAPFTSRWIEVSASEDNELENYIAAARWEWNEFSVPITIMLFLMVMILIKIAFRRIPHLTEYVPESLLLIILGIIFGLIVKFGIRQGSFDGTVWNLTPTLFFNYLLPPIVLESAYSLYNRTFSEYLGVVLIFAVLGTVFNFFIIGFIMYGLYLTPLFGGPAIQFDLKGMLLFSSLIVAVDPVAVLAIFQDIGVELSLYYIVFGESLLNDAITVVLYDIMSAFAGKDNVSGHEIGVGIASFFTVSLGGFLIGVIVGILSCLFTRIKSHLGAFILLLLAYFSYILTDCVGWSGIIAMIGCGLVQAAYAFHNLDPNSVTLVHKFTKLVAEISESVIFLYLGIAVVSEKLEWHTGFMLWGLVLCLVSRALVVLVITAIVNAVHVDGTKITFTEQAILIYGGLRGAVAFSLAVLIVPDRLGFHGLYSRRLMITATLFIILFTVGFMGLTMKPLVKLLKIRMQHEDKLSLMNVLNNSMMDEVMVCLESVTGTKGRNRVRDLFMRLDEKYFRKWLQREPVTYDEKLMKVYEKISLKLHYAQLHPHRRESFLEDLPESLRNRYIESELHPTWSDYNLTQMQYPPDVESGDDNVAMAFANCIRSTRRAALIPNDKRQIGFDRALHDAMRTRMKSHNITIADAPAELPKVGRSNEGFFIEDDE